MFQLKLTNFGRRIRFSVLAVLILIQVVIFASAQGKIEAKGDKTSYQNFNVEVFCCIQDEQKMIADPQWLEESWNLITRSIKIEKVFVETYRDNQTLPEADVKKLKDFFTDKGVKVSGGIMASVAGLPGDRLNGFCYSNPADREKFRKIVAYSASLFDEIIFDDLFIFNCQCDFCQRAKGNLTWAEYRLNVMKEVGENLVVKNAQSVNPRIHLIFKPPNWYEQYQFSGYNLESQPKVFDEIWPELKQGIRKTPLSSFNSIRAMASCVTLNISNPASLAVAGLMSEHVRR